ncbi:MAG TPA: zf-HC2 domain-containing protein, partial [Gemmataceae bacterium]|nr:zf-HC2 domain-containing protein [Gemmataceae bacterium]
MSEHQWVSENLATFVADGLDAAERERLEQHTANCSECAAALADARAVSDALEELFVTERPDDALEDRLIQSLREQSLPWSWRRLSRTAKVLVAAAAVIVLTVTGAGLTALLEEDQLSFPGHARNNPNRVLVAKFLDDSHSMDFRGGTAFFQDLAASPEALASKLREQSVARLATKGVVVPPVLGYLDSPGTDARVTEPTEHRRNLDEVAGKISELKGKAEEAQRVLDRLSRLSGARAISAEEYNAAKLSAEKHAQDLEKFVKSDPVAAQAFSPDGKRLAASGLGPGTMAEYAKPPEVRIWAATTGTTYYGRSGENGKLTTKFEWFDDGRSKTVTYFKPEEVMATVCRSVSLVNQDKEKPGTDGKKDGGEKAPKADPKAGDPKQQPQAQPVGRKIIRSGDMEFEVDSFDNAVAIVNRLVDATKGGFVATTNSDKLPNGKVRGSVVVRV